MTEQIGDQKTTALTAGSIDAGSIKTAAANAAAPIDTAVPNGKAAPSATAPSRTAPIDAADSDTAATTQGLETRHAALRYTTLRLALFLAALLFVWGVAVVFNMDLSSQLSKLTLLAVALLLSSAVSFIALSKYRDAMSAGIVARTQRLSKKFDEAAAFEDEDE